MNKTVADIAKLVQGEVIGDGRLLLRGFSGIKEAQDGDLTFLASLKYEPLLKDTQASAVIVPKGITYPGKILITVENPSLAFTLVVREFLKEVPSVHPKGIHPTAVIAPNATLGKGVAVGPYTIIEAGACIGDGAIIYGQCFIGAQVKVGADCLLYSHVSLREHVSVGNRVIIHNGAVLGADGYGYVTVDGQHMKIPQVGTVVIEDDVEIGANVTIDRARFDKTVIGQGTKIDNLVHIAHNVIVGKHCLIVAQVGVSGSTTIGNYVVLAGQVGVVGHLTIGDGAIVAAQSGVSKSIKAGETVFGSPCQPIKEAFKTNAHVQRLDHYVQMIKDLKKRIEELEKK